MSIRPLASVTATLSLAIAASATLGAVKFTSTWTSPDSAAVNFTGKKVAAIAMTDDMSLRMSTEEALARALTARKIDAIASYRIVPGEELRNPDRARAWFERDKVAGAVILRPVSTESIPRYAPNLWISSSYASLWDYYPTAWSTVYVTERRVGTDFRVVVESLVYDVSSGKLIWGGVSETTNPKSLQSLVAEIVEEAGKLIERRFRG